MTATIGPSQDHRPKRSGWGARDGGKRTVVNVSDGFADLLRELQISLAFTSYQSGQLFMVGVEPGGRVAIDQQHFERAMGVHWRDGTLHLATATQIIRFENMLLAGELGDGRNDVIMVPRLAWTTNDVDAHELAVDRDGRPLFVATKFNCVATVDGEFSFSPIWMPAFIDGSDKGDRCHLNGLALEGGALAYVSAAATSDAIDGWREQRDSGGVVVDCRSGAQVVTGLSMPHSPRVRESELWFLESGTGKLACFDRGQFKRRDVAFCPGFARGLQLMPTHAVLTVSKPRDKRFEGLRLEQSLSERDMAAWCGVVVVNLVDGAIDGWLRFDGPIQELFDVAIMPGVRCPRSLGPGTRELWDNVRPRAVVGSVQSALRS